MAFNTLDHVPHGNAMDKAEAMATKFSENFAISLLKKHKKF